MDDNLFKNLDERTLEILTLVQTEGTKISEQLSHLITAVLRDENGAVIDTCDFGHKFAKLEDHPRRVDGKAICPKCTIIFLKRSLNELAAATMNDDKAMDYKRAAQQLPDLK